MAIPFGAIKKPELSQKSLVAMIKDKLSNLTDVRTGKNTCYDLSDAALSAFAVFFLQTPSFLAQQIHLQKSKGQNNLQSLFGTYSNPCDNQIRSLLDAVSANEFYAIFSCIFKGLHDAGYFATFTVLNESLLIALDGVEYFSSEKIHCDCCSRQELANGKIRYSHKVVTPVVVSPKQSNVIPLAPEFITPQDGHSKQDCELAAANRWLLREGQGLTAHNVTLLGDDLFSHQPYCEAAKAQNMHFILVCKEDSHPTLYEWLDDFSREGKITTVTRSRWDGKHRIEDTYRLMNELPLRDSDDAMRVNWCELKSLRDDGKILYYNTFVTDHALTANTVVEIVEAGRSRWIVKTRITTP